ncbi:MAG: hypothetical protein SFZ03_03070 [Candidatus Melainabacteria bacterium]|nr:hypothetical protein [Candidatus Melainabacteria bacterium]
MVQYHQAAKEFTAMDQEFEQDMLLGKFCSDSMLNVAHHLLCKKDQTEEEFIGSQIVLFLNGQL